MTYIVQDLLTSLPNDLEAKMQFTLALKQMRHENLLLLDMWHLDKSEEGVFRLSLVSENADLSLVEYLNMRTEDRQEENSQVAKQVVSALVSLGAHFEEKGYIKYLPDFTLLNIYLKYHTREKIDEFNYDARLFDIKVGAMSDVYLLSQQGTVLSGLEAHMGHSP